jgi:hypothetical protein
VTFPYAQRAITLSFRLGNAGASFGGSGANTVTLTGLRVIVALEKVVFPSPTAAMIRVFGMTMSQISQISTAGLGYYQNRNNLVMVQAGDAQSGMVTVFNGWIQEAYPLISSPPDAEFVITASNGAQIQLKPTQDTSFKGSVPVSTVLAIIVSNSGYSVENNGVNATLSNPHFSGSVWEQVRQACEAANCHAYLDDVKRVVAIWPKTTGRDRPVVPVSAATGMIGYPVFEKNFIKVRHLFTTTISAPGSLGPGVKINVTSQISAANGIWDVLQIGYNLASELPDGPWETMITAQKLSV